MLGDVVYEGTGKLVSMRVLDNNGTMELTFQEQGKAFGIPCSNVLTYVTTPRPDGITYAEGRGVLVTVNGDTATIISHSIGMPKPNPPATSIRGASFFYTQSPKLARFNKIVCVHEVEANEDWTYTVKDWEWK
ncbi:MAG: hypothetical protein ACXV5H_07280 [Halobacteriota archaeon]